MFGKNLVPEIWVKMLPANHIAAYLNERNLRNKSMK